MDFFNHKMRDDPEICHSLSLLFLNTGSESHFQDLTAWCRLHLVFHYILEGSHAFQHCYIFSPYGSGLMQVLVCNNRCKNTMLITHLYPHFHLTFSFICRLYCFTDCGYDFFYGIFYLLNLLKSFAYIWTGDILELKWGCCWILKK